MVGFGSCAGAVVDFDVDMREVFTIGPERVLQTTPGVYFGEAPRAAASFNHTNSFGDVLTQRSWPKIGSLASKPNQEVRVFIRAN